MLFAEMVVTHPLYTVAIFMILIGAVLLWQGSVNWFNMSMLGIGGSLLAACVAWDVFDPMPLIRKKFSSNVKQNDATDANAAQIGNPVNAAVGID